MTRIASVLATATLLGCAAEAPLDQGHEDDVELTAAATATSCGGDLAIAAVSANGAQAGNPAAHAIDGNLATRWSQEGVGSWITADLGAARTICGVGLAWYQGDKRTNQFTVAVSSNGTGFTQVASATSSGGTAGLEPTTFAPTSARYVRITFDGNTVNDWSSISELAVHGAGFVHPGVLVSGAQLARVKQQIAAGAEPWQKAWAELVGDKYVRAGWTASPRATIECGSHNNPDLGCTEEYDDANAAYANALAWAYTGTTTYADVAIAILDAYARVVKSHTNSNAPLESAWAAERFVRAAEIIRHTSNRWSGAAAFGTFMRTVYLPLVRNGWPSGNGNWDLSMLDATVEIAVYTDDRALFDAAIAKWKLRVPAYIYLHGDGTLPVRPSGTSAYASAGAILTLWIWPMNGSGSSATPKYPMPDGLVQETCRDFGHVSLGLTSMLALAETAWIQGVDLYSNGHVATRITKALELTSTYENGTAIPSTLCGGEAAHRPNVGFLSQTPYATALNFAVGYNHYANRLHVALPQTQRALATIHDNASAYRNKIGQTALYENLTSLER